MNVSAPADRLRAMADSYRLLVFLIGGQLLAGILMGVLLPAIERQPLAGLIALGGLGFLLGAAVVLALGAGRLAHLMGTPSPWLWAGGMLVPYANLFALVGLDLRARAMFRRHGIRTGFLGARREDLDRLAGTSG